jgi:plastocyanin
MTGRLAALTVGLALLGARLAVAVSATSSLAAVVQDDRGVPIPNVVVSLMPAAGVPAPPRTPTAIMDQQNKEFVPHVLAVGVGTPVSFPNRDNIRHHVYSFSPTKKFELPLYIGTPASPVVFDKPGPVILGCNIHDWMVGYIYVVPTPYFAKTGADGQAQVADVPPGPYEVRAWHPRMKSEPEKTGKPVTLAAGDTGRVTFVLALKPERRGPQRPAYESAPQS